jgi:hypothetical protein
MHYDVAANRWSMATTLCFPPYLEGSNGSPWGYAYNCRPWSQHTYLWYAARAAIPSWRRHSSCTFAVWAPTTSGSTLRPSRLAR